MPETLRWPVVLFDLDGTLADSIELILASYDHAFSTVTGQPPNRAEARRWIGQTLAQTFQRVAPAQAAELEAAYRVYNQAHLGDVTGYPGLPGVLAGLRDAGAATGVITSKGRDAAQATLQQVGLAGLVSLVGGREDSATHKPSPAPLLAGLAKLGAQPGQAVYVGDAIYDVQAAQAGGLAAVAVTWGAGLPDELAALHPTAICHTPAELRAALLPETL